MAKNYTGPVVFINGVHYPATDDGADLKRPLRWEAGTEYRDAEKDEDTHNDIHHEAHSTLAPGSE